MRPPSPAARALAAVLAGRAAFGLAFLAASAGGVALPAYFPTEHRWALTAAPEGGIAMMWFGATALALAAATLFAAITWAVTARGPLARLLAKRGAVLALARTGALVLAVDFVYFGVKMTHQPRPDVAPASSTAAP